MTTQSLTTSGGGGGGGGGKLPLQRMVVVAVLVTPGYQRAVFYFFSSSFGRRRAPPFLLRTNAPNCPVCAALKATPRPKRSDPTAPLCQRASAGHWRAPAAVARVGRGGAEICTKREWQGENFESRAHCLAHVSRGGNLTIDSRTYKRPLEIRVHLLQWSFIL